MIGGDLLSLDPYDDDLSYVRDLGLIAPNAPVRVANPIYREVIVRVLSQSVQESVTADPRSFVRADGGFDFHMVLAEFADWYPRPSSAQLNSAGLAGDRLRRLGELQPPDPLVRRELLAGVAPDGRVGK